MPAARVTALRGAYAATLQDPAFLADAKKLGIEIAPVSGGELARLMAKLMNLPPALVERAKQAIAP